jgi:hypothetical protein
MAPCGSDLQGPLAPTPVMRHCRPSLARRLIRGSDGALAAHVTTIHLRYLDRDHRMVLRELRLDGNLLLPWIPPAFGEGGIGLRFTLPLHQLERAQGENPGFHPGCPDSPG